MLIIPPLEHLANNVPLRQEDQPASARSVRSPEYSCAATTAFFEEAASSDKPDQPGDEDFLGKALGRFNAYVSTLPASGSRRALFDWRMLVAAEPICASLPLLKAWLEGWGTHFNLVDPWCYDIALCTLLQYQINELLDLPQSERPTRFVSPTVNIPSPLKPTLPRQTEPEDPASPGEPPIWPTG